MWKHRWPIAALALCLQCGGSTQSAAPVEDPSPKATEAEPKEETAAPAEESASSEGSESTSETSGATEAKSEGSSGSSSSTPKKKCADLEKKDCEVRTGCAWNTIKKCVEDGGGE
jgi:hypothetical protein